MATTIKEREAEAAALLRVANASEVELPAVTTEHWHEALVAIRRRLSDSVQRRWPRERLRVYPGGEA